MILFEGDKILLFLEQGTIQFQQLDHLDSLHFYGKLETQKTPYEYVYNSLTAQPYLLK